MKTSVKGDEAASERADKAWHVLASKHLMCGFDSISATKATRIMTVLFCVAFHMHGVAAIATIAAWCHRSSK